MTYPISLNNAKLLLENNDLSGDVTVKVNGVQKQVRNIVESVLGVILETDEKSVDYTCETVLYTDIPNISPAQAHLLTKDKVEMSLDVKYGRYLTHIDRYYGNVEIATYDRCDDEENTCDLDDLGINFNNDGDLVYSRPSKGMFGNRNIEISRVVIPGIVEATLPYYVNMIREQTEDKLCRLTSIFTHARFEVGQTINSRKCDSGIGKIVKIVDAKGEIVTVGDITCMAYVTDSLGDLIQQPLYEIARSTSRG